MCIVHESFVRTNSRALVDRLPGHPLLSLTRYPCRCLSVGISQGELPCRLLIIQNGSMSVSLAGVVKGNVMNQLFKLTVLQSSALMYQSISRANNRDTSRQVFTYVQLISRPDRAPTTCVNDTIFPPGSLSWHGGRSSCVPWRSGNRGNRRPSKGVFQC